jgi:hypothetical protein
MPKGYGGMGFRDLKLFNQALLARQACARLLKARYFPYGDIIDTVFPSEGSPTWKTVEYGLDLVKKGIAWRIGSGTKVQIWRDPWINWEPTRKITMKKGCSRLQWVSQLMLHGRREWDEHLIRECLYNHDVMEVLQIRLSDRSQED